MLPKQDGRNENQECEYEKWKEIPGYEGEYAASTLGRILSLERIVVRSNLRLCSVKQKILKLNGRLRKGTYLTAQLNGESKRVHRLVWITFVGQIPDGYEINHKDGVKSNNNLTNLELATHKENMEHAVRTKLFPSHKGEKNGMAYLTDLEVLEVRKLYKEQRGKW